MRKGCQTAAYLVELRSVDLIRLTYAVNCNPQVVQTLGSHHEAR